MNYFYHSFSLTFWQLQCNFEFESGDLSNNMFEDLAFEILG
jgi:hypothetical protein